MDRRLEKWIVVVLLAAFTGLAAAHEGQPHRKEAQSSIDPEEHSFGRAGDPRKVSRTVRIDMSDRMRFTPSTVRIRQGETVRFVVRNGGKAMHEMVIGTLEGLKEHAQEMRKHPGMEHDDAFGVHVAPGRNGSITWQFTRAGEFHFGCLVPGHFEAGMSGRITVEPKGEAK